MTAEIAWTLGVVAVTLVLFAIDRVRPDIIALGVLAALVLAGLLPIEDAFSGLGSETFVLILGLLVMTATLEKTGAVDIVGEFFLRFSGNGASRLVVLVMVTVSVLSAFMSNTGSTAFFLPVVIGLASQIKISRSKVLMPLAFASILSSSVTLISTSTNIVVSGMMTDLGLEPLGMFELTPVGIIILTAGLLYMSTVGLWLVPERPYEESLSADLSVKNYLTELLVAGDSPLCGKTLSESQLGKKYDITVLRIMKQNKRFMVPNTNTILNEGDLLLVEGDRDEILKIEDETGLVLKPRKEISKEELSSENVDLFEVILLPRSPLIARTLKQANFRQRFGLQVLGINRSGHTLRHKLSGVKLEVGDQLLLHGSRSSVRNLNRGNVFRLLHVLRASQRDKKQIAASVSVFAGVLVLASLNIIPLSIAAIIGMILVFSLRLISPEEAYQMVDWRVLILIGSMLALGAAIQHTGTAAYLSGLIVRATAGFSPRWLLGGFFLLTMLLSQPMSNQAASAVVIPIAVQTAFDLGLNPRTFAVMIAVGASTSFLTPLEPACMMVYGPGNYRFIDFVKVGSILSILIFAIAIVMVPILWPFF